MREIPPVSLLGTG